MAQNPPLSKGVRLEHSSWKDAEKLLTADSVVVIPIGAALKEHGPHLRLRNDLTLAEYFADRVTQASAVVATPPLTYHFYPAFLDYAARLIFLQKVGSGYLFIHRQLLDYFSEPGQVPSDK